MVGRDILSMTAPLLRLVYLTMATYSPLPSKTSSLATGL